MRRAALILAALLATCAVVLLVRGQDDGERVVRAEFANAAGLRPGSVVRVGGTPVGSVRSVRVTGRNTAETVLALSREALPLGAGAEAAIRAANLLGEKFIDLTVGDRARPLHARRIALSRTSTPVELDDAIDILDPTTRGRLGLLLAETGIALGGRGRDLRELLRLAPGSVEDVRRLLAEASTDTQVLERLLDQSEQVSDAIADERKSLGQLVATGERALAAPAANRRGLGTALHTAPPTLTALRRWLRRLDRTGDALRPAVRGLRATAAPLSHTLNELPGFVSAARPALEAATDAAPALNRLGRHAAPTVRRLRPTAAALRDLATDTDTLTGTLDQSAADILGVAENWARANQSRDGVGHLFRVSLSLTPDALRRLQDYLGPSRRKTAKRQPVDHDRRPGQRLPTRRPATPPAAVTDALRNPLKQPLDAVRKVLDKATAPPADRGGDAATDGLLDFLLR